MDSNYGTAKMKLTQKGVPHSQPEKSKDGVPDGRQGPAIQHLDYYH